MSTTLPPSCSVADLAAWLQLEGGATYAHMARAVRALVEAKVREAVSEASAIYVHPDASGPYAVDLIVSRVLGGAS